MLQIVCVQTGNYQGRGAEYVNVLYDSVRRNLSHDKEGKFVCFTDDPKGLDEGIETRSLPDGLDGWWNKLWLFSPGLFPDGDRIVYFDLDTLIIGSLDHLVSYRGGFATLGDYYRPGNLQSSVMLWEAGQHTEIWSKWDNTRFERGDQVWIEQCVPEAIRLQAAFPGLFVSFKKHCAPYPSAGSKVVIFHGEPRPHNCGSNWVKEVWKTGGLGSVDIEMVCNTINGKLEDHCKSSIKRGLEQIVSLPAHNGSVCIVGGGPSVITSRLNEIRMRQEAGQHVWALNGSAKMLNEFGIRPDGLWIVDARADNAEFAGADSCRKFIASQCAPETFDKAGPDTSIWHDANCGDWLPEGVTLIGGGTTVGMKAIAGAYILGFRKMHLFGYDSSLDEGSHHAYPQPINDDDWIVDAWCDGQKFKSTPWMVQQVKDFEALAVELAELDCEIHVHGDGLLPHLAKMMMRAANPAHVVRGQEILSRLPEGPVKGAEIGVFTGALSSELLKRSDLSLVMVDSWAGAEDTSYLGDSGDYHAGLTQAQQDSYFELTRKQTEFAGSRATILRKTSLEAARDIPNGSLDFVFIDADHSYEGCRADIAAWLPKLKPKALLSGHDYGNTDFEKFGVDRAVQEFAGDFHVDLGRNFTWFIQTGV